MGGSEGVAADVLVQEVAREMGRQLASITELVHERLTNEIPALRMDQVLLDLLAASIESNLETFVQVVRLGLEVKEITRPPAAAEYARRLAQRGTEPSALLRSYRLGQETALLWALDRIAARESDRSVALLASRRFVQAAFQYVDLISVSVLAEYEGERVRWLANSNSVRAATLSDLLTGPVPDVTSAENSLGYRLRQHHVAVVLWLDHEGSPAELRALEHLMLNLGQEYGVHGAGLFVPQDRSTAWGWLPFGRQSTGPGKVSPDLLRQLEEIGARIALGSPAAGVEGFRSTHHQACSAHELALVSRSKLRFLSWAQPDVRAATLLLNDLEATRRLVRFALGGLADDTETNTGLRQTVRTFLAQQSSFPATASLLNVHKNTVRYRVEKAAEIRGRPLDEDRLDLELALVACEWLGETVLER